MAQIKFLRIEDTEYVHQAAAILEEAFPHAYCGKGLQEMEECLQEDKIVLIALEEEKVLGLVGAAPHYDGNVWELHPLAVREMHREKGIGKMLTLALEKECRLRGGVTMYLGTDDEFGQTSLSGTDLYEDTYCKMQNAQSLKRHAFAFYQKIGYKIVGVVPDANGPGKPDIMMAKRL